MISFEGSFGANPYQDRPGIICRTVKDAPTVLDAFRDKKTGTYFDAARSLYGAAARDRVEDAVRRTRSASYPSSQAARRHAHRRRSRAVREETPGEAAVSDGINKELQGAEVARRRAGRNHRSALSRRSVDSEHGVHVQRRVCRDRAVPHARNLLLEERWQAGIRVPGWDVTSRKYLVALSAHKAPLPADMNFRPHLRQAAEESGCGLRLHLRV